MYIMVSMPLIILSIPSANDELRIVSTSLSNLSHSTLLLLADHLITVFLFDSVACILWSRVCSSDVSNALWLPPPPLVEWHLGSVVTVV